MSTEILTDHKRISFVTPPVEDGLELDGSAGVLHLADDEQFSGRGMNPYCFQRGREQNSELLGLLELIQVQANCLEATTP